MKISNKTTSASWQDALTTLAERPPHKRNVIDDGFFSTMAQGAYFESILQFPQILPVDTCIVPTRAIPFSKLNQARPDDCCVFYEKDPLFSDYLLSQEVRETSWRKTSLFAPADCSLYRDMPLCLQIANTYMSRLSAHDLQRNGLLHAPLCRWSDERTYEPFITDVPIAFIGLPKNNAVWVGTYGVSKRKEDRIHLRKGLISMLHWLEPEKVFVYGPTPNDVFSDLWERADFVVYPNWTKRCHEKEAHHG